jgi:outer membrane immunogenic protein
MKPRLISALGAVALITGSFAVQAADLGTQPVQQAYRAPVATPGYNWTGMYLGVNGGYGWGSQDPLSLITDRFDRFSFDINGGLVGGTFGAQIQSGRVVLGLEGDIDWANIKGSTTVSPALLGAPQFNSSISTKITSVSTARMRVGYAADNVLFYGTAGVAILGGHTDVSVLGQPCGTVLPTCAGSGNRAGMAAGGGLEYGFTPNWSAKIEYLWIGAGAIQSAQANTVRAGLNFRFGGN